MKNLLTFCLLAVTILAKAGPGDPAVSNMSIRNTSNVSISASQISSDNIVKLKVPIQNFSQFNSLPIGSTQVKIDLGAFLSIDPAFDLSTALMSNYYTWTVVGNIITGTQIAIIPADLFGGYTFMQLKAASIGGSSSIKTTIIVADNLLTDDSKQNNSTTLNYTVITTANPLPVELLTFSGVRLGANKNLLKWTTSKEKDFDKFVVEKSNNSKTFEGIGQIKGEKNQSSYLQNYSFEDANASYDINYYRLKMVDLDGSFKYSNIISLENETEKSIIGEFYPNPTTGNITNIDIVSRETGIWNITTVDASGRVLKIETQELQKGTNKITIGNQRMSPGINYINFEFKKESAARKLIKQ